MTCTGNRNHTNTISQISDNGIQLTNGGNTTNQWWEYDSSMVGIQLTNDGNTTD